MKALERVAAAGTLAVLIGGAFFTPQLVARADVRPEGAEAALTPVDVYPVADETPDDREPAPGEGFTDLYGNEVSDALATYTFDQTGSLYELHSPQTELPRLGSPKS